MEREQFSRRELFRRGAEVVMTAGVIYVVGSNLSVAKAHEAPPNTKEPTEYFESPTLEGMMDFTVATEKALHGLEGHYPLIQTMRDVRDFRDEFVPYLARLEYINAKELVYPNIRTEDFGDDRGTLGDFFLLGYSECIDRPATQYGPAIDGNDSIAINERYFEPYSEMQRPSENPRLVQTLSHEIVHSNKAMGSCTPQPAFFGDTLGVESTTQIVSTEALAAMSQDKAPIALPAFLTAVARMGRGWILKELSEQDRVGEYDDFLGRLPNHSEQQGRWRLWTRNTKPSVYVGSAKTYGWRPMQDIITATQSPDGMTPPQKADIPKKRQLNISSTLEVLQNLSHYVEDYR